MHDQHGPEKRVEAARADEVAIVGAPEHLQPGVDPLDRRAALVQALKLFGGAGDRRKTPQVQLALDPDRPAVRAARVAAWRARAVPAFVARPAAVVRGHPSTTRGS